MLFLLAGLVALPAQAAAPHTRGSWDCSFTQELRCDPGRDCATMDAGTTTRLWEEGGLYMSCTPQECMPSAASFRPSGDLMRVYVEGLGAVLTLSANLEITEVSMIADLVFIRRGRCTEAPAPSVSWSPR
jgi:hypothetical protein